MYIGQEEANKLGYPSLHHTNGDKTMCCYINEDGVSLKVYQKDYDKKGTFVARISAIHGLTEIRSPEIAFPHEHFEMFENELYSCLPDPDRGGRISITKKWFDRRIQRKIKSTALINFVKELIFGKEK